MLVEMFDGLGLKEELILERIGSHSGLMLLIHPRERGFEQAIRTE